MTIREAEMAISYSIIFFQSIKKVRPISSGVELDRGCHLLCMEPNIMCCQIAIVVFVFVFVVSCDLNTICCITNELIVSASRRDREK